MLLECSVQKRPALIAFLLACSPICANDGVRAEYVGGTVGALSRNANVRLDFKGSDELIVHGGKSDFRTAYHTVKAIEYGQSVGRRYFSAILISPVLLLSKARKHFLTIEFIDRDGMHQAMVFRIDKKDVRPALASIQARTGLRIEYQDDEARRSGR